MATTLSPYGYVTGDPINNTDPAGLGCAQPGPNHTCLKASGSNGYGTQCTVNSSGRMNCGPAVTCGASYGETGDCPGHPQDDFSDGTSGLCLSGEFIVGGGGMASVCLVWNSSQVGVTVTTGPGVGFGIGASAGFESSNAQCLQSLKNGFWSAGGGAGIASGSVSTDGGTTVGYGGLSTPGFSGYGGWTNTWLIG